MNIDIENAISKASKLLSLKSAFFFGDDWFAIHELYPISKWVKRKKGFRSYKVLACDDCGNEFLTNEKCQVFFWDHETADIKKISESLLVFLDSLQERPKIELEEGEGIKSWIDPAFLKEQRTLGNTE